MEQALRVLSVSLGLQFSATTVQQFNAQTTSALAEFGKAACALADEGQNDLPENEQRLKLIESFTAFLKSCILSAPPAPIVPAGDYTQMAVNRKRIKKSACISQPARLVSVAKRPVNSWMAYRAYYQVIFKGSQQKNVSGMMRRLWENDLFRSKWSMIANVYSVIRNDVGKLAAPMDRYLQIVSQLLNIIPAANYLERMGWVYDPNTGLVRKRIPPTNAFTNAEHNTNLSVGDLLRACVRVGYYMPTNPTRRCLRVHVGSAESDLLPSVSEHQWPAKCRFGGPAEHPERRECDQHPRPWQHSDRYRHWYSKLG